MPALGRSGRRSWRYCTAAISDEFSVGLILSSRTAGLDVSAFTNLNPLCESIAATAAAPNVIISSRSKPGTVELTMSAFVRVEA